jgi:hypothetical protein
MASELVNVLLNLGNAKIGKSKLDMSVMGNPRQQPGLSPHPKQGG